MLGYLVEGVALQAERAIARDAVFYVFWKRNTLYVFIGFSVAAFFFVSF